MTKFRFYTNVELETKTYEDLKDIFYERGGGHNPRSDYMFFDNSGTAFIKEMVISAAARAKLQGEEHGEKMMQVIDELIVVQTEYELGKNEGMIYSLNLGTEGNGKRVHQLRKVDFISIILDDQEKNRELYEDQMCEELRADFPEASREQLIEMYNLQLNFD